MANWKLWIAPVVLALTMLGAQTHLLAAAFPTGNDLVTTCEDDTTDKYLYCLGFISGAMEGLRGGAMIATGTQRYANQALQFCVPEGATVYQAKSITVNYLKEHPGVWHQPAAILVTKALRENWPCKGAQ